MCMCYSDISFDCIIGFVNGLLSIFNVMLIVNAKINLCCDIVYLCLSIFACCCFFFSVNSTFILRVKYFDVTAKKSEQNHVNGNHSNWYFNACIKQLRYCTSIVHRMSSTNKCSIQQRGKVIERQRSRKKERTENVFEIQFMANVKVKTHVN